MIQRDYTDKDGILRRVMLPDDMTPPEQGILISVYLDEELKNRGHPIDFIKRLYRELWARGVVSPSDYLRAEAPTLLRSALLATYTTDVQELQLIAKEQQPHGNTRRKS